MESFSSKSDVLLYFSFSIWANSASILSKYHLQISPLWVNWWRIPEMDHNCQFRSTQSGFPPHRPTSWPSYEGIRPYQTPNPVYKQTSIILIWGKPHQENRKQNQSAVIFSFHKTHVLFTICSAETFVIYSRFSCILPELWGVIWSSTMDNGAQWQLCRSSSTSWPEIPWYICWEI